MNQNQLPNFQNRTIKGLLLIIAGVVLFLYVTNIITVGLQMLILLASIILVAWGIIEMDGYHKLMRLVNKKNK